MRCQKPRGSRGFEPVDWRGDYTEHTTGVGPQGQCYASGVPIVTCRISVGEAASIVDRRLYTRAHTVRRLNRQRPRGQRLAFPSTTHLAREMLTALAPHLPAGCRISVLVDSWYGSTKLLRFCLRHGWHGICDLTANRTLDGRPLRTSAPLVRHQSYDRTTIRATDGGQTSCTHTVGGHLRGLARRSPCFHRVGTLGIATRRISCAPMAP